MRRIGVVYGDAATGGAIEHNRNNQLLIDGCAKLGYDCVTAGQNLVMEGGTHGSKGAAPHFICLGDRYGNKQSTPVTFFEDAAKCGAKFIDRCEVERVVHEGGRAKGIIAYKYKDGPVKRDGGVGQRYKIEVDASAVVVAAGSIHSPALLLRSKVPNGNIGKNLRLHPVTGVTGAMDENVSFHIGAPMTTVSNVGAAGSHGRLDHYGYKLECPSVQMGLAASVLPWEGGAQFKSDMLAIQNNVLFMALCRDKNPNGKVVIDAEGTPRVHYTMDKHDSESLEDAIEKMCRIAAAAGAKDLATLQQGVPKCVLSDEEESDNSEQQQQKRLEDYLAVVKAAGVKSNRCGIFSAHQMGTCRMGSSKASSVSIVLY
jgi:choline dehydrogenase-like flavoprotein